MMKMMRTSLLAACLFVSASAFADVTTHQGEGANDTAACTAAKHSGQEMIRNMNMKSIRARYEVTGYGQCSCEPPFSSGKRWCSIDMYSRQTN
jgi:hypothetical protein